MSISIEYIMHIHSSYHISIIYTLFIIIYTAHQIPYITHKSYISYIFIYILYTFVGGNSYSNVLTFADFDLLPAAHQAHAASAPELFTARLARLASPHEAQGPILVGQ